MNADYFQNLLTRQNDEMGGASRVEIHLKNGQCFHVRRVDHAGEACVLLTVFPSEGMNVGSAARRRNSSTGEVVFDRVAISYDVISHVLLSYGEPETPTTMDFLPLRS